MTTTPVLDLLARVLHDAAGLLVELQASRPKPEDLARLLGTSHLTATRLLRNAELFDADQLAAMRTARLSLDTIFTIGKYWRKLSNSQADREGLFADVIARAGADSLNELEEHLKEVVGALNRQCADKPRSDWARFSRTVDCDGKGYLNIKAPAEALARMNSLIDDEAKAMFHQGHACSIAEAKATIITRRVITYGEREASQSEGEGVNGEDNPLGFKYRPFVVICHPWLLEKRDGKYLTTDGTVVDLRGYADRMLEPFGWVTVPYFPSPLRCGGSPMMHSGWCSRPRIRRARTRIAGLRRDIARFIIFRRLRRVGRRKSPIWCRCVCGITRRMMTTQPSHAMVGLRRIR